MAALLMAAASPELVAELLVVLARLELRFAIVTEAGERYSEYC